MRLSCRFMFVLISLSAWLSAGIPAQESPVRESGKKPAKIRVYVDTDTANEVDDPYAVFRALVAPKFDVIGLSSMSWRDKQPFADGVKESQRMNEDILALMKRTDRISHPLGALTPMTDIATPSDSPAARDIITKAKAMPAGQKLHVFVLGAFTNIASALLLDPGIKEKILVYAMGYNYVDGRLETNEFNCGGDMKAADSLLTSGVELHVMAANSIARYLWPKADVDKHFKGQGGIRDYLVKRWETYAPNDSQRVLCDTAVFEAFLHPNLATEKEITHKGFRIRVWTDVDTPGMQADYWAATQVKQK